MEVNNNVLLDKITFTGIRIKKIEDLNSLIQRGILEVKEKRVNYRTEQLQEFTSLQVKDETINRFFAGAKLFGNKRKEYCHLTMIIAEETNFVCYTLEDYKNQLEKIKQHLKQRYGIETDFSCLSVREMELNKTIQLNHPFGAYKRVLSVIMGNLPYPFCREMRTFGTKKKTTEYNTFYADTKKNNLSKRYTKFKIYNKTKELEPKLVLTESYMRVEITLIGTEKIKKALGTNQFYQFTKETLDCYFNNQMEQWIEKPIQKWKEEKEKKILRLMKEQRKKDIRHWQTNTLRLCMSQEVEESVAMVLDVEEIIQLVNLLQLGEKRNKEIKKNLRKQAQKYEPPFCNRDDEKLEEILHKLLPDSPSIDGRQKKEVLP